MTKQNKTITIVTALLLGLVLILNISTYLRNGNLETLLSSLPIVGILGMTIITNTTSDYTYRPRNGNVSNKKVYPIEVRRKYNFIAGMGYSLISLFLFVIFSLYLYFHFSTSALHYVYLIMAAIVAVIAALHFKESFKLKGSNEK